MIEALTLVNLSTNEEININMTNGEYWLGEADLGQTESDIHTFKYINQIGESVYNTSIEPRSISIQGWIAGWDENKGISVVIANSEKGEKYLHQVECLDTKTSLFEKAAQANDQLRHPSSEGKRKEIL